MYGAETWRINKKIESRTRGFEGRCLRRILHIKWQDRISKEEVKRRTGINGVNEVVKRRRWTWFGHALRMNKSRLPHAAFIWAPPGKRKRGRPMGTWRRTIEEEMHGKTLNEIGRMAQDRDAWRKHVGALCSARSTEDTSN